ncbi:unnamed protein product [Penicillium glandicola]
MAQSDFEPFKLEIERLYIHEDKSLPYVKDYMASKYSLDKSQGQYSRQLKKWGFDKGHIKADEWKWIGHRENKRKLNDNKESEFHSGGKQIDVPKVKKAKYRDAYISTIARFSTAPSPKTPEGFSVYTPASPGMNLIWNEPLPWLRFIKLVRPMESEDTIRPRLTMYSEVPSPSSSLTICSPRPTDAFSHTVNHELARRLSTIIPWNRLSHPPNIQSSSRTSTALKILMPEEFPGQHDALSIDLNSSKNNGRDRMALELFLLSNNIISQDPNKTTKRNIRSDDERVMQMLSDYGWKDLKHIQTLLSTREPTAEAIAEKVFASALRLHDVDTVKMMLEAHMDPNNTLIETIDHGVLTPLQFVSGGRHERGEELVELLISYGADVNHSCNENPPLLYAINEQHCSIIRALMFHGAIITPSCLSTATRLRDTEVFTDILNSYPDVNAPTGWQSLSALGQAVKHRNVPIIEILLANGANIDELVIVSFVEMNFATTAILGLGAQSGSMDVIQALLRGSPEMNPDFDGLPYVSPIVLAVQTGNVGITRALLLAGVNIKPADDEWNQTLLERAVRCPFPMALCKLLIEHGAQVDRPVSAQKNDSSALLIALEYFPPSPEVVKLLINAGARLNDEYTEPPYTALGAAIGRGDRVLIDSLFAAGATFVGTNLKAIGSLATAMYLQTKGVFQDILRVSGLSILAAALSAEKADLAQYLLEQNADCGDRIEDEDSPPTPLEAAIKARNFVFAKSLLERGAKVTDNALANAIFLSHLLARFRGSAPTAIVAAIYFDTPTLQLLQLLKMAGVDPTGVPSISDDDWNYWGRPLPESVLELAAAMGTREVLQFLLQWMPWSPRLTGRALTFAILSDRNEHAGDILPFDPDPTQDITMHFINGYEKFRTDEWKRETYNPLEAAVDRQMVPIAHALMKKADVNYLGCGARRRTALQLAVEKGNMELVNLLLEHNARIDSPPATDGGATALQIACLKGYIGIARRLIDLGADVNEPPAKYNGRTALQGAAEYGRIDMLQIVLNEGALIVGEGEPQYLKAVALAESNGHYAAARMLRSWRDSVYLSPSSV